MNVSAKIPKRQFIASCQAQALYSHGDELPDGTLIAVEQRVFLTSFDLNVEKSGRKNPQFLNRSV